ncbi:MAG: fatty acid desaturase [Pirellulales bacterium]|nr:fatty acid desaturase [Pirellulales bacterium]
MSRTTVTEPKRPTSSATSANQGTAEPQAELGYVPDPSRLPPPEGVAGLKILWPYVIGIGGMHLLLPLAFFPYFFSWTGVVLALLGLYVFGTLGINLCYHRLLTHRSFECPRWLERTFAILGVCCLQDAPGRWVVVHRLHHQHSDERPDPHSPLVNFLWGHVGWLLVANRDVNNMNTYEKYGRDIFRDPFYMGIERNLNWLWIYVAHVGVFYLGGFFAGWAMTGDWLAGVQFGLSLVVWGVIVRTVAVWHITWSVNSVTHLWGYRNYETDENSKNNWFVGLVSNGEGWHNNHHAEQRAAAHGHRWWEFDVTYLTIWLLERVGLAQEVVLPRSWSAGKKS